MRSVAPVAAVSRRDRLLIFFCLAAVTALSWAYLVHLARHPSSAREYARMMAEMGMAADRPWTAVDALLTFTMWTVMMIGMMTGSAAPMLMLYAGAQAGRHHRGVPANVLIFGIGYLTAWAGFSAVATLAQWALQRTMLLSDTMAVSRPIVGAAILIIAGLYQLTPFKSACLMACRSPLGFLMTNWREGRIGAFRMGVRHGVFCLGCCWALMIVLFTVGVMNLVWVAVLAMVVLIEKVTRFGVALSRAIGIGLIAGGAYLLW